MTLDCLTHIPRYPLAHYPTPLLFAGCLSKHLNNSNIYFKRDDLISFGLGGNKIRALEIIIADALHKKADTLITGAGVQSNHVRATAAAAAVLGLDCTAVYWGNPPEGIDGNYRVTKMLGATIHFTHDTNRASVDDSFTPLAQRLQQQGKTPYIIPRGGACALGAIGHVLAVQELYQQCLEQAIQPDVIVLAGGSGGTYAGWLLGIRLLALPWRVQCFSVSRPSEELCHQVIRLANEAAQLLNIDTHFSKQDLNINDQFIGAGYGIPSPEAEAAITLVGRTEGVLLDPTYTGKAMAGYLHAVQHGAYQHDEQIIFIHSGGEPAFFAGNGDWLQVVRNNSCA